MAIVGAGSRTYTGLGLEKDVRDDESAVVDAGNRTGTRSGFEEDAGDDGSTILGAGNRTGARSALKGDVGDNKSVAMDDRLAARDDGSAVDNNRSAAVFGNRINVDNGLDARVGNQ